jgi:hypothetical protein
MRRTRCALWFAALAISVPSHAQTPVSAIVFAGRVTQAGDTTVAVGGADIEIVGTALRGYANGEGRFRFADIPPGSYELRVRRLGYEPSTFRVVLQEGRAYEQSVELRRHPNALTEIRIEGRMLKVPARFEDVYARAARENGTFFTRQDIDKLNPYNVKSLLNLVPTVHTNDRGVFFQRCNPGLQVLGMIPGLQPGKVQIYIDGTRVTQIDGSVNEALQLVIPRDIEAMEVYTGVGRLPAEFLNDACAVIAIWTKSY